MAVPVSLTAALRAASEAAWDECHRSNANIHDIFVRHMLAALTKEDQMRIKRETVEELCRSKEYRRGYANASLFLKAGSKAAVLRAEWEACRGYDGSAYDNGYLARLNEEPEAEVLPLRRGGE